MENDVLNLLDFIDNGPTAFHVVENIEAILKYNGFICLSEKDRWDLEEDRRYYTKKNDSSIIAFEINNSDIESNGFKLIGAHIDSPSFKIKPNPVIISEDNYVKLNTEIYGGPILSTWFDRPLSIAGKVVLKSNDILNPEVRLINIDRPIGIIPSLAPHLSRELKTQEIDKQKDVLPLVSLVNDYLEKDNLFLNILKEQLEVEAEDILDFELFLYDYSKGNIVGINEDLISVGRLDDLWMVHASLYGLLNSKQCNGIKVGVFLNSEEIGSKTQEGADSIYLKTILRRITIGLNKNEEDFYRALSNSIAISADLAHGVHPNFMEKHDLTNRPVLGKGIVIKYSSNKRYLTDGNTAGLIISLCEKNDIPYQKFVNPSNLIGGSTMGVFFSSNLSIPVVDLGCSILSMHSIRELGSTKDVREVNKLFKVFFEI